MAGTGRVAGAAGTVADAADNLPPGSAVVALSGGPDSAVAAWLSLRVPYLTIVDAVHVHHGFPASAELQAAAEAVAARLGIDLRVIRVEVPEGASLEGRARDVRMAALEEAATDADWIVTGHHADDSTETTLSNLLRGAGAAGLSGIAAVRGKWVRPLIDLPRSEIRDAAVELGLPFADDPANVDPRHRRNVIRTEVLPWLEESLDLPVSSLLKRSGDLLAADDRELERYAAAVPLGDVHGAPAMPAVVLATLPGPLASRAARALLRRAHPPYPGSSADVAEVLAVAAGERRRGVSGGLFAEREGPMVVVHSGPPAAISPTRLVIGEPVDVGSWRVGLGAAGAAMPPLLGRDRVLASAALLDLDVMVRSAVDGDRIDLDSGSKPVREAMREAGIPDRLRPAWPIVVASGKIAWVAGARLAGWARARSGDDPAAVLTVEGIRP